MTQENKVKIGIVLGLFLICLILILIVFFHTSKEETPNPKEEIPFAMTPVTEYNTYFSVLNNLNQYLFYVSSKNNIAVYNALARDYIAKNNINSNNVLEKINTIEENVSIKAKEMYYKEENNNYIYFVKGDLLTSLYEEIKMVKKDSQFLVILDYTNLLMAIYPLNEEELNNLPLEQENAKIIPNSYNQMLSSGLITDDYICNLYYSDYFNQLMENVSLTYELLDEEPKQYLYPNKEEYVEFISGKLENISPTITNCKKTMYNGKRVYNVTDEKENHFTFTENSIMNYKVKFSLN